MNLISIITPVYNAEKYIREVYQSITSQTHTNWEWIAVEDCSTDQSWTVLEEIAKSDLRVRLFRNNQNSGAAAARNTGLENTLGEYIAFLDADDKWVETKLEKQLQFMKVNNVAFCCHNYDMIDEAGAFIKPIKVPNRVVLNDLVAYNPLGISFVMIKSELGIKTRFDASLKRRQDWVFWYHLIQQADVCLSLPDVLGSYRKDSIHSISKNKVHMALLQWKMYRTYFHLNFFKSVISFIKYAVYGITKHYL